MRILYLGASSGTALHRAQALTRSGHDVVVVEPNRIPPGGRFFDNLFRETGGLLCEKMVRETVLQRVSEQQFDLTWVDGGKFVGPRLIDRLRQHGPVINYSIDDPLGGRDRFVWTLYQKALPHYDLQVVMREINAAEAIERGARRVMRVFMSADEVAHAPRELSDAERRKWSSDVLFVGTWMEDRGAFMAELLRRGVPLSIYGARWQKAKEWPLIEKAWKGAAINDPGDYTKAIQCAKISLGLLSKGNRDQHTTRTMEIPFAGGVLCAQRTPEHEGLYQDGVEAVFWSDAIECASVCRRLLDDEDLRNRIASNGRVRCLRNGHINEIVVSGIIERVRGFMSEPDWRDAVRREAGSGTPSASGMARS